METAETMVDWTHEVDAIISQHYLNTRNTARLATRIVHMDDWLAGACECCNDFIKTWDEETMARMVIEQKQMEAEYIRLTRITKPHWFNQ